MEASSQQDGNRDGGGNGDRDGDGNGHEDGNEHGRNGDEDGVESGSAPFVPAAWWRIFIEGESTSLWDWVPLDACWMLAGANFNCNAPRCKHRP